MKPVLLIFAFCAPLAEIVWCRPGADEQQESNVPNPGAGVLLEKIIGDWEDIETGLQKVGGMDGLVKFLKEKDPKKIGSLLDAYEIRAKDDFAKPSDILKTISDSIVSIKQVCDPCGGLGGLVDTLNLLLEGKFDVPPAHCPLSAPQQPNEETIEV